MNSSVWQGWKDQEAAPPEKKLEKYLTAKIEAMGGKCLKLTSPGTAGICDRLLLLPGEVVAFVELKKLGELPTPLQQKFMRDVAQLGFYADYADCREAADEILAHLNLRVALAEDNSG